MYAGPDRRSFAFFLDVVAAVSDERPGMTIRYQPALSVTPSEVWPCSSIEGRSAHASLWELC